MSSPAGDRSEATHAEAFAPELVRAFGEVARVRFGLARMERNPAGLARRLSLALSEARLGHGDATRFVEALAHQPAQSNFLEAAADAVTNRETWFFRDQAQLSSALVELGGGPEASGAHRLRALSAGCSTGEEALSVAMLALELPHLFWAGTVSVTGVDLSPRAIQQARAASYRVQDLRRAERGPEGWSARFFRREGESLIARPWLCGCVDFEVHNLLTGGPVLEGDFDLVLCRNVLIYFDQRSLERTIDALVRSLRPGGLLVLGHAEAGLASHPELSSTRLPAAFRRRGAP